MFSLRDLPFFVISFSYFWAMSNEYGYLLGFHLTILAISFFILCSPLGSYLYLFGILPGSENKTGLFLTINLTWTTLLLVNLATIFTQPQIYAKAFICKVVYSILTTWPTNILTLTYSFSFLIYHRIISLFAPKMFVAFFHSIGVLASSSSCYFLVNHYHPSIVAYLISMSSNNY